ncbi:type VI secretion system membrane subunit TssM [Inhella sp.]|uniref:type VI secretion system membrane subunit TssM n=1 Tax=Inhella sp. TaxID=1921806 RepID=UPI0035B1DD62
MKLFFRFLFDLRTLSVLGLIALATFLFLGADMLRLGLIWALLALLAVLLGYGLWWALQKARAVRAARRLEQGLDAEAEAAAKAAGERDKASLQALRGRMDAAVKTIKTSKLGQSVGKAALYELPWYMIIGNPAAGKSTAVLKSGLNFPFADQAGSAVQGIGGTRNCDWFFTSEGILLDTAGRYSVHEEDRSEWLGFLRLLKRARPLAPINGILIAVSVAELSGSTPDAAIQLAKSLRQRVQELTESLEVFAPVYLVFTKVDLVAGFVEFFADRDAAERDKIWGATLPYKAESGEDAVGHFERHFDELQEGLRELTLARMSLQRGQALPTGVLSFPLEFAALKPALRSFVATLFEDNPFQFKPVFRGFYFTSSVQEGSAQSPASAEVAKAFGLQARGTQGSAVVLSEAGYFLRELFSKVVFADRNLVRQYASRGKLRLRTAAFAAGVAALALLLGMWAWSALGNRQLLDGVEADLRKVVALQAERVDLGARLEALEVLQQRIEELERLRDDRPLGLGFGLYQGEAIERKLRAEYFAGIRQLMLQPVAQAVEGYLTEVNQQAADLSPLTRTPDSGVAASESAPGAPSRYTDASPTHAGEAYNALKTYLMLAERSRMEPAHLTDQITRFWRGWLDENRGSLPRDQLVRSAERLLAFSLAHLQDPAFPVLDTNLALVDQTRENLRKVMRGMPARDRVYAEIKARAATRFAPMTVARILTEAGRPTEAGSLPSVVGSYAIPGSFTRQAWEEYVQPAIKQAATTELQRVDWVLNVAAKDDLSLEGSPEQIRAALTELYKTEYVKEWQRFVQGVTVAEFQDFGDAVKHLNRLGDASDSPLKLVLEALLDQTSWDNPSILNDRLKRTQGGVIAWFKQSVLRMAPSRVEVDVNISGGNKEVPMGPIGREFAALPRLMLAKDSGPPLVKGYFAALGKLRSRFNTIANEGNPGPGARSLMSGTLEAGNSELAEALRFVDEQMMLGLSPSQRSTLRPLLVRPLMQAYAVSVPAAETELNRRWEAEVYGPFQRTLAGKYPFDTASRVEAGSAEIAKLFGPEGAIAKFGNDTLGTMVVRRGDSIEARTWADIGLRLRPAFLEGYGRWIAPLDGAAAAPAASTAPAAASAQYAFQVQPQGAPGLLEYTLSIDGQQLRYRNGAAQWTDFVWPNPAGQPGVRLSGITVDGRTVEFINVVGAYGLDRMFSLAKTRRLPGDINEMSWSQGEHSVSIQLRIVRAPGAAAQATQTASAGSGLKGLKLPPLVVGVDSATGSAATATAAAATATGAKL